MSHRSKKLLSRAAPAYWSTLAKAQAHVLKSELEALSRVISLGHALETRAHLAASDSWNHYSQGLLTGTTSVNALTALQDRLQGSLRVRGVELTSEEAQAVLKGMEAAGVDDLRAALQEMGGHVTLFSVTGTPLNLRVLGVQLAAVNETEVVDDLEQARPHAGLRYGEPELVPMLASLSKQEGPGVLACVHTPKDTTWAYLPDERHTLLIALAQATLPEFPSDGEEKFSGFRWSQGLMRRTSLPSLPVPTVPEFFSRTIGPLERWANIWIHGKGIKERLAQLDERLPAGFPFQTSLPSTLEPLDAHLTFWDALEAVALQARGTQVPFQDWSTTLDEGTRKGLLRSLNQEVQAVLKGIRTRFPEVAQVEIRAAVAAGLSRSALLVELQVLLEDAQWHARQQDWTGVHDLRKVRVGDTLRLEGGTPFQVQAVMGVQHFRLSVIDHRGLPCDITDTQRLERRGP